MKEALKLALDELIRASSYCNTYDAIDAIKKALAQDEFCSSQEPVDCEVCGGTGEVETGIGMMVCDKCHGTTYTTPPKRPWVRLTDDEIDVIDEATWDEDHKSWGIHDFARAIEDKLKELNT